MVHWNDPAILVKDYGKFPDKRINLMSSPRPYSCCHQAQSCRRWYLHVRSLSYAGKPEAMITHNNVSWETILTANFELDVFRGNRPYRRTIWVNLYAMDYHHHLHWNSYI
jgi:hypothetical protein